MMMLRLLLIIAANEGCVVVAVPVLTPVVTDLGVDVFFGLVVATFDVMLLATARVL